MGHKKLVIVCLFCMIIGYLLNKIHEDLCWIMFVIYLIYIWYHIDEIFFN